MGKELAGWALLAVFFGVLAGGAVVWNCAAIALMLGVLLW